MRINAPLDFRRLSGEALYRQVRGVRLGPCRFTDGFFEHTSDQCFDQFWRSSLDGPETESVLRYAASGSLSAGLREPSGLPRGFGGYANEGLDEAVRCLASAVSKSVTGDVLARHYSTRSFISEDTRSRPEGRVYILGSFASFSSTDRIKPGYGAFEIRIAVPFGAGRGMFIPAQYLGAGESEFLVPPGTTVRIVSVRGRTVCAEAIRTLNPGWCTVRDDDRKRNPAGPPGNGFGISSSLQRGSRGGGRWCRGMHRRWPGRRGRPRWRRTTGERTR